MVLDYVAVRFNRGRNARQDSSCIHGYAANLTSARPCGSTLPSRAKVRQSQNVLPLRLVTQLSLSITRRFVAKGCPSWPHACEVSVKLRQTGRYTSTSECALEHSGVLGPDRCGGCQEWAPHLSGCIRPVGTDAYVLLMSQHKLSASRHLTRFSGRSG